MIHENLTQKFTAIFRQLGAQKKISEAQLADGIRELRKTLLIADVHLDVVKNLIQKVKDRARKESIIKSVQPSQMLLKIVYDELKEIMGEEYSQISFDTEGIQAQEKNLKQFNTILQSITPKERRIPEILNSSRKKRIARRNAVELKKIKELLKCFKRTKKAMKQIQKMKFPRKPEMRNIGKFIGAKNFIAKRAMGSDKTAAFKKATRQKRME